MTMKRYALVKGLGVTAARVAACLPDNYKVEGEVVLARPHQEEVAVVIGGRDRHGWTLDGYIRPRLDSGLLSVQEIDLSHEVMSQLG